MSTSRYLPLTGYVGLIWRSTIEATVGWSTVEGTLTVHCSKLWQEHHACSSCSIPLTILQLAVASAVPRHWDLRSRSGAIWMCQSNCSVFRVVAEDWLMRPKKIKYLFALLAWKLGGSVGQFFFFFFFNLDAEEMQYHSRVHALLGTQSLRIGLTPVLLEGGWFPLNLVKEPFWASYEISEIYLKIFVQKCKIEYLKNKKQKKTTLIFQYFGSVRKGQTSLLFRPDLA